MGLFGGKTRHQKEVEAAIRIATNLYEVTKPGAAHAPAPLNFELPDSSFRYLIFCISTMQVACAAKMKNPDAILNEVLHLMIKYAAGDSSKELIGEIVDAQTIANKGAAYLRDFLHQWSAYVDIVQGGNRQSGTSIVCGMIRSTESKTEACGSDAQRILPLALWIENSLPAMRRAF